MILPPAETTTRMQIDSILASQRLSLAARRVETICTMASTDSVGFIAMTPAQHFSELGVVSILPLELPDVAVRMGMIWMHAARLTEAHHLSRQLLREIAREMLEGSAPS